MTFDNFVKKYSGSRIDYDGCANVQCVDLARIYSKEVLENDMGPTPTGYACGYFTNPTAKVKEIYTLIANTPSFVPKKGDVMVWSSALNGAAGHIAVCDGVGNTDYFYSYDYNWRGVNDGWTRVRHTYNCVLGVLRPKDQSKITGKAPTPAPKPTPTKVLDNDGLKKGDNNSGVLALKRLLLVARTKGLLKTNISANSGYGAQVEMAVNELLKSWGYKPNGIAGQKFIDKLSEKVQNKIK